MAEFAAISMGVSTLMSVKSQLSAAGAAQTEAAQQAEMEGIQARQEAIDRRERLITALAQQNASVGARGIQMVGTPKNIQLQDIEEFGKEDATAKTLSNLRQRNILTSGANAASAARARAGVSLIQGIAGTHAVLGGRGSGESGARFVR